MDQKVAYTAHLNDHRFGIERTIPTSSGKMITITRNGTQIDEEDVDEVVNMVLPIYCFRQQKMVHVKPFIIRMNF